MKQIKSFFIAVFLFTALYRCSDNDYRYIDLNTGKRVNVVKDSARGYMINAETKEPVVIYYDTQTKDTIFGTTGEVINNKVIKTDDGKYKYEVESSDTRVKVETDGDIKVKEGDYKKKVQSDGDIKIKEGDTKIKIEANGDKKVKTDK